MSSNRGPELEGVVLGFLLLCLITVSLRSYTMGFILKRFFLDDYLAILALLMYIAFAAVALISISYGLGKHEADVAPSARPIATKFIFIAAIIYIALSYLVKVIVGLFLVRIFSASHQKWQRLSIWTMLAVMGLFYGAYFFLAIFTCNPVEYAWTRDDPVAPARGRCSVSNAATAIAYIATVLNCAAAGMLTALPATAVWKARLDARTRVAIGAVLAIGTMASVAAIVRAFYANELVDHDDYLYNFVPLATWSTVEAGAALTASSLATLQPLCQKFDVWLSTMRASGREHGSTKVDGAPSGSKTSAPGRQSGLRTEDPRKGSLLSRSQVAMSFITNSGQMALP